MPGVKRLAVCVAMAVVGLPISRDGRAQEPVVTLTIVGDTVANKALAWL